MLPNTNSFTSLIRSSTTRPRAAFFGSVGIRTILRDQASLTTWLCVGAVAQGLLFFAVGRLAILPALALLIYRALVTYGQATNWLHNPYMDDVIPTKFSAQFPDEVGAFNGKPSSSDVVVLLIGTRMNHPLGILAPGAQEFGQYFGRMAEDLEKHADEFGYLGMTSWINNGTRQTKSELLEVAYFRTIEGLHEFAHSKYHIDALEWWNKNTKQYPYISIFHEVYHAPAGHWENIYVNSHPSNFASTTYKFFDQESGEEKWASPVVAAGKGVLRTSAGRLGGRGIVRDVGIKEY